MLMFLAGLLTGAAIGAVALFALFANAMPTRFM